MSLDARRETFYAQLVVLLLNQGRNKEAAEVMERHEARREWEAASPACPADPKEPPASDPRPDPRTHPEQDRMTVAALYVDPKGVYAGLPDVELWDETRDARQYAGPHRVVAHPPCARWCQLAPLVQAMHGYMIGDDGGCFEAALKSVRTWGGVLEHPAYTHAWKRFELPRPQRGSWQRSFLDPGWVTEISQVAYGHPARKRTWLYFIGPEPPSLDWSEPAALTSVSDLGPGNSRRRGVEWEPGVQYAEASATPLAFRDVLLGLARSHELKAAA